MINNHFVILIIIFFTSSCAINNSINSLNDDKYYGVADTNAIKARSNIRISNNDVVAYGNKIAGQVKTSNNNIEFKTDQLYYHPQYVYVKNGHNIRQLAEDMLIRYDDLIILNDLYANQLEFKQDSKILLPNYVLHKVMAGDTIYKLGRKYSTHPAQIIEANDLQEPYNLDQGKVLKIFIDRLDEKIEKYFPKNNNVKVVKEQSRSQQQVKKDHVTLKPKYPTIDQLRNERFIRPSKDGLIRKFGKSADGTLCNGVEFKIKSGGHVMATASGEVALVKNDIPGVGQMIVIKHVNGYYSTYGSQMKILVKFGEKVTQGERIARINDNGYGKIYFSIKKYKKHLNPNKLFGVKFSN